MNNLRMAESRDFRCHSHKIETIGDRSVPTDHIPVRLVIEYPRSKQKDHPVIQRLLTQHPVVFEQ